ncbi:MAG: DUF1905 domain-containing protein, partial [Hymenobacter sp.]
EAEPRTGDVLAVVPFSVADAYGTKDELPVQTRVDGFPYQGELTPLGDGYHALIIPREVRRAVGKTVGDVLRIALSYDPAERVLAQPDDLAAALAAAPDALAFYKKLPLPEQRAYLRWLAGAKKPDVRAKRLTETVYRLERGLKRP